MTTQKGQLLKQIGVGYEQIVTGFGSRGTLRNINDTLILGRYDTSQVHYKDCAWSGPKALEETGGLVPLEDESNKKSGAIRL